MVFCKRRINLCCFQQHRKVDEQLRFSGPGEGQRRNVELHQRKQILKGGLVSLTQRLEEASQFFADGIELTVSRFHWCAPCLLP